MTSTERKTALVTGSSRGIGAAIAERLARDGFNLVVNYAGGAKPAAALVARIEQGGGETISAPADVGDPAAAVRLWDAAEAAFGGVDVRVNNAGITVAPGPTATSLFLDGKPQEAVAEFEKPAPLERLGQPEDIAADVSFLSAGRTDPGSTARCCVRTTGSFDPLRPAERHEACTARGRMTIQGGISMPAFDPTPFRNGPLPLPRRVVVFGAATVAASAVLPNVATSRTHRSQTQSGVHTMSSGFITTKDGAEIFYKDWGPKDAQPIVFHHGWPLSSDDWDNQMLFFLSHGYRVVAHDRRGHGRSSQIDTGHDMDHYAADASAVAEFLDLRNAVHIGHSTGGGEVARYVAQFGQPQGRVAKAVLVSAVPPLMVKTDDNPEGTPISVFDDFRTALAANRAEFFAAVASGPFYGFNRPGTKKLQAVVDNWWRQGMMGSALAHYHGIKAFSETDQTADLKAITVPTMVMQGDDDQVVPYADAVLKQIKLLKNGTLKVYPGFPHGMLTTHADTINPDLLAFVRA